jgi:hypothetical protein
MVEESFAVGASAQPVCNVDGERCGSGRKKKKKPLTGERGVA